MPLANESAAKEYREAWDAWRKQLDDLHAVFLNGESRKPEQLKGLLNRESRAKERYDAARNRLLGLDDSPLAPGGDNPFR
jgi:hypothetical protein